MRAFSGKTKTEDTPQSGSRKAGGLAIASHPIFTPALTGWAAAILALVVVVLPSSLIARLAMVSGLEILGDFARFALAVIAGLAGAGIGYGLARLLRGELNRTASYGADAAGGNEAADAIEDAEFEEADWEDDGVRPIDPATELGSEYLDAPIEEADFEECAAEEIGEEFGEELGEAEAPQTPPEPAPEPKADLPATSGRRRGLAQLARAEAMANDPQLSEPSYGASNGDNLAHDAPEPELEPELEPMLSGEADAETESENGQEPEAEISEEPAPRALADEPEQDPHTQSRPAGLPDAAGAQSALDALIETASAKPVEPLEAQASPVEMELEAFGALAGRNGNWVEDEGSETAPAPEPEQPAPPPVQDAVPTALAQLRAKPIEELSMVQMIERFAAALEDRKSARVADPEVTTSPARKQALAKTLKGLTGEADMAASDKEPFLEPEQRVEQENAKLRDALNQLGDLRGAA